MKLEQFYMTIKVCGRHGLGTSDVLDWREACDDLAEAMVEGRECAVYLMDPPVGRSCGMMVDVTEKAERQVREWLEGRHTDAPEEINDPTDDRYGEWKEARAMEAAE